MENEILNMYFNYQMKQKDIANVLHISKYKVSRIISKDSRYIEEKERRKAQNKIKHENDKKEQVYLKRKNEQIAYEAMKLLHIQSSIELSHKSSISNKAFRDWNSSVYEYNSKTKKYNLKKNIITGIDVPKTVKW